MLQRVFKPFTAIFLTSALISTLLPFTAKSHAREISPQPVEATKTHFKKMSDANILAESTKSSVVRIESGCQGKGHWQKTGKTYDLSTVGSGSGFFIKSNGSIATSAHVVELTQKQDRCKQELKQQFHVQLLADGEIADDAQNLKVSKFKLINQVYLPNKNNLPFRMIRAGAAVGEGMDIAVIKVDLKNAPALKLADSDRVRLMDNVTAIGYPAFVDSPDLLDRAGSFYQDRVWDAKPLLLRMGMQNPTDGGFWCKTTSRC